MTIRVAPKLSEGGPPSGAIRLDQLVTRYLISIGVRDYQDFTIPELHHFSLLALYRVVKSRGLEEMDVESFWEWIRPNGKYSNVMLLPDTPEGRSYHAEQMARRLKDPSVEETVILHVNDVKSFIRKCFIRLLLEEIRGGSKQKKVLKNLAKKNAPAARRAVASGNDQPLDEFLQHSRMQRAESDLEAVRMIKHRVEASLDPVELKVIQLLFGGYKAKKVADLLGLEVKEVYQTQRTFTDRVKKMWYRFYGSPVDNTQAERKSRAG